MTASEADETDEKETEPASVPVVEGPGVEERDEEDNDGRGESADHEEGVGWDALVHLDKRAVDRKRLRNPSPVTG